MQTNNLLHGIALETILTKLVNHYGWEKYRKNHHHSLL